MRHYGRGMPAGRLLLWLDFPPGRWVFAGAKLSKKNQYGVFNDGKRSAVLAHRPVPLPGAVRRALEAIAAG